MTELEVQNLVIEVKDEQTEQSPAPVPGTPQAKKAMLIMLLKVPLSITGACRGAGVGRTTYYEWLQNDALFAEQVEIARAIAEKNLVEKVMDSHTGARWLLTQSFGESYKEKIRVEHEDVTGLEFVIDEDEESDSQEEAPAPQASDGDAELAEEERAELGSPGG
jgi:hypothetical protein